jgi:hypothetical protein
MRQFMIIKMIVFLLAGFYLATGQTIKRGRDEGTISISPSNVMGNGNLTMFMEPILRYSLGGSSFNPVIGAQIGISDMMQLVGQFTPIGNKGLGPIEGHLQITTPNNDNLRFFGLALRADLFLSSAQDTLSSTAQSNKPEYNPYLFASVIADLDWLALWRLLPIKTYLSVGMMDNIDLLPFYNQLSIKAAGEWKGREHSAFFGMGMGLYQEKRNRKNPGDKLYPQNYFWIEPGGRYRLFSRYCIVGSTKLTLFQTRKEKDPFKPELFNISLKFEVPILLRETNTEVIRSLIFMESKKKEKLDSFQSNVVAGKSLMGEMNASLLDLPGNLGEASLQDEKEALKKKREETHQKMDEIERLFMQLDKDDKGKFPTNADTVQLGK